MHEILFRGQTLHFKNTLAGGTQPFISYFPPVSEARRSICFPVFVPDAACQVVSVAGRRAHVRSSSLVTDERDDGGGAGRYWWKMKGRTVCRTLPGCGGHPGGEIGQMLRSVSAGLCFTITTAAEGWGVCTHLNLGFLTRRRQPRSLKPFCNENPLSRRSESDISTSYLDLFAAPLYLFAFSLNVSSLILELLLGVCFVFFAAWPEIPWSLSPRTFVPASKELPSSGRGSVRTIKGGLQCDLGRQRTGPGSRLRSLWSPACLMNTNVPSSSLPGPNKEVCQCVSEVPWNWTGPHVWTGLGRCWHI